MLSKALELWAFRVSILCKSIQAKAGTWNQGKGGKVGNLGRESVGKDWNIPGTLVLKGYQFTIVLGLNWHPDLKVLVYIYIFLIFSDFRRF